MGRGGDVAINGQVGEEGSDVRRAQVFGVLLVMEEDVALDPIYVSVFGATRIMFDTKGSAELVEEFGRFGGHGVAF